MKLIIYVNPKKIPTLFQASKDSFHLSLIKKSDLNVVEQEGYAQIIIDENLYYLLKDNSLL